MITVIPRYFPDIDFSLAGPYEIKRILINFKPGYSITRIKAFPSYHPVNFLHNKSYEISQFIKSKLHLIGVSMLYLKLVHKHTVIF